MRFPRRHGLCLFAVLSLAAIVRGQTLADFFDTSRIQELRLEMPAESWKLLHDKYLENTYYRCDVRWRDIAMPNSGVRSRGSGSRNPIKPALSIDFSRYDSSQRLLGLKSVVLRNFAQDTSMIREVLTLKLFEKMGLPHERTAWARLYVNSEYVGLYQLVEPVDSRFLRVHFGEDNGYLYEFNWTGAPYHFEYLGDDPNLYVPLLFEPKNHEDAPQAEVLVEWIRTANQASDAEFAAAMNRFVDLPVFLTHLAVEQYVAEFDGLLGFAGMTNFYLYRRASDNRFVFLVWDKDNAFHDWTTTVWNNASENILVRRALAVPELRQRYLEALHHAAEIAGGADGWLATAWRQGYDLIRQPARDDPYKIKHAGDGRFVAASSEDFEEAHRFLSSFFRNREGVVTLDLARAGFSHRPDLPDLKAACAGTYVADSIVLTPGSLARTLISGGPPRTEPAAGIPLPYSIGGLGVRIGEWPAPILRAGQGEIVWQVPWEALPGPQLLCVTANGVESHAITVEVHPNQPSVAAMFHANWLSVDGSRPAAAGEILILYVTGLGNPMERPQTGMTAFTDRLSPIKEAVSATAGGKPAKVLFAGLAPGLVGVQLVTIEWPEGAGGNPAPLILMISGEAGEETWVPVS